MFEDADILGLKPQLLGVVVWVALIVTADTAGRTEGNPIVLRETILGGVEDIEIADIESVLQQLVKADRIQRYGVGRRQHIQIGNYSKHQRFQHVYSERPSPEAPMAEPKQKFKLAPEVDPVVRERRQALERLIHKRIKAELSLPHVHNLHQIAGRLIKDGLNHPEQIMVIVSVIHQAGHAIKVPYAYIRSSGLLNTALSKGIEAEARKYKVPTGIERTLKAQGLTQLSDVLASAMRSLKATRGVPATVDLVEGDEPLPE